MDHQHVQSKLIEVLNEIQSDSGYQASLITGATCPVNDLEGFDSIIWFDAIGMLANSLEISIPEGQNIFFSSEEKRPLTVDESCHLVCQLIQE